MNHGGAVLEHSVPDGTRRIIGKTGNPNLVTTGKNISSLN